MPDPTELADAAERLRRVQNGERLSAVYHYTCRDQCDYDHVQTLHDIDRNAVANAYLAREAELAKEVDRDWLVSVLGEPDTANPTGYHEWLREHDNPWCMLEWRGERCSASFGIAVLTLNNRGDVRAFLRLARWPTNENGGE